MIFRSVNNDKIVKLFGRAGLLYEKDERIYFVDCEWLDGKPNISIFIESIFIKNDRNIKLSLSEKKIIATELAKHLENQGLSVELYPFYI